MRPAKFEATEMICPLCLDVFKSKFEKDLVYCKCGESGIDETKHWARVIGPAISKVRYDKEDTERGLE